MHDSFLMQNISKCVNNICEKNGIKKIDLMDISVDYDSHINEKNLLEHLMDMNPEFVNKDTVIKVNYEDIKELSAIIRKIEGKK